MGLLFSGNPVFQTQLPYDPVCRSVGRSAGRSDHHYFLKRGAGSYTSMLLSEHLLNHALYLSIFVCPRVGEGIVYQILSFDPKYKVTTKLF